MTNGLRPCLKQVAPMMRPQMVVTTMWANFMIGLAYHLDNFTICQVYEAIWHVIATVETPIARMALVRDRHAVPFLMARVRDGGIPCGSCKKLDSSHKRHPVKKAAIEASSRVSQAGHKQVLLEISDVPRILTPWRAMQPCNMPSRRWRREEINAAREAL